MLLWLLQTSFVLPERGPPRRLSVPVRQSIFRKQRSQHIRRVGHPEAFHQRPLHYKGDLLHRMWQASWMEIHRSHTGRQSVQSWTLRYRSCEDKST